MSSKDISSIRQKAENGDAAAQYILAEAYENGQDIENNLAAAGRWYILAAANGNPLAELKLNFMLLICKDDRLLEEWRDLAQERGLASVAELASSTLQKNQALSELKDNMNILLPEMLEKARLLDEYFDEQTAVTTDDDNVDDD